MKPHVSEYFEYDHLPQYLQDVSKEFHQLAIKLDELITEDSEQRQVGYQKLLEAKDCFVEAAIALQKSKQQQS